MKTSSLHKVASLGWDELEQNLAAPKTRGAAGASEQELRDFFGEEEFEQLKALAAHAQRSRDVAPRRGNIVFIPGIMGSDLATEKDGDLDKVWVNFVRLILGAIGRLELAPDGSAEKDRAYRVLATGLEKRTYTRGVLWLRARWNVETFPYDWRKDLDDAARKLGVLIQDKFPGQPVHLVAHSMGGLVSRNFIRLHPQLWQGMRDQDGHRGGKLIMLGTPNFGSFTIPQVLTGAEPVVRKLAAADLGHSLEELLRILATFVGSYQMLPSPAHIPASAQAIYRRETWGEFAVSPRHLARAFQFHYDLEREAGPDAERMVYVAGSNQETLSGLQVLGPGDFRYFTTRLGDGRVTHQLGLLPGVPAFFVEEIHGDLAKNESVLAAVEELLETGSTTQLATSPPAVRAVAAEGAMWRGSPALRGDEARVRELARQAQDGKATPAEAREAETALTDGLLARKVPAKVEAKTKVKPVSGPPPTEFTLDVEVVCDDITKVKAPLVAVGHYRGVEPANAEGALDRGLNHLIKQAGKLGMIGGGLGEIFFIPVYLARKTMKDTPAALPAADVVALAGMGTPGTFSRDDLRYLVTNLTLGVLGLRLDTMATVLIGAGTGGLPHERAVRSLLQGILDAFQRLRPGEKPSLKRLLVVEYNPRIARKIQECLARAEESPEGLRLKLKPREFPASLPEPGKLRDRTARDLDRRGEKPDAATRITIERAADLFRFSALTSQAVVPVREVTIQSYLAEGVAERLKNAATRAEQDQYGRLLYTYLVPEDFQGLFSGDEPVSLVLDRATAAFPWEMACFGTAGGVKRLGTDLRLTRQFRTLLSSAPGVEPPLNRNLKVLVIADPAPEPELRLPGARKEGREVARVFQQMQADAQAQKAGLNLDVVERIGSEACDPVEILALLLSGEFDVVHYAGHGAFDEQHPDRGGWVFGRDRVLSSREIFRARRVPRLVFANACFSAVVRPGESFQPQETSRKLAGLAEAFFERGIQNFIGSGWPVDDDAAVAFARDFYTRALAGQTLREAVSSARERILEQGPTWGAYQFYGSGATELIAPSQNRRFS